MCSSDREDDGPPEGDLSLSPQKEVNIPPGGVYAGLIARDPRLVESQATKRSTSPNLSNTTNHKRQRSQGEDVGGELNETEPSGLATPVVDDAGNESTGKRRRSSTYSVSEAPLASSLEDSSDAAESCRFQSVTPSSPQVDASPSTPTVLINPLVGTCTSPSTFSSPSRRDSSVSSAAPATSPNVHSSFDTATDSLSRRTTRGGGSATAAFNSQQKKFLSKGDFVQFSSRILLPGQPQKWKLVRVQRGPIFVSKWEAISGTADPTLAKSKEIAQKGLVTRRNSSRITRATNISGHVTSVSDVGDDELGRSSKRSDVGSERTSTRRPRGWHQAGHTHTHAHPHTGRAGRSLRSIPSTIGGVNSAAASLEGIRGLPPSAFAASSAALHVVRRQLMPSTYLTLEGGDTSIGATQTGRFQTGTHMSQQLSATSGQRPLGSSISQMSRPTSSHFGSSAANSQSLGSQSHHTFQSPAHQVASHGHGRGQTHPGQPRAHSSMAQDIGGDMKSVMGLRRHSQQYSIGMRDGSHTEAFLRNGMPIPSAGGGEGNDGCGPPYSISNFGYSGVQHQQMHDLSSDGSQLPPGAPGAAMVGDVWAPSRSFAVADHRHNPTSSLPTTRGLNPISYQSTAPHYQPTNQ